MNVRIKLILLAIIIPLAIYLWPAGLGGNTTFLIVQGQSMYPTILPGSFVVAKNEPPYEVGEIVGFVQKAGRAEKNVVHRIIEDTDNGFRMKGDNNEKRDAGFYTEEDIFGRILFATPYVGDALGLLRNPMVLLVSAVIIGVVQMEQGRRKKRKERIRRIRLGLPPEPDRTQDKLEQKKPKKPDYTLFFAAIAFNVIVYVSLLIVISSGKTPQGDMITGFLFESVIPSFANTLIFALYFIFIFGLYFLAKFYEVKSMRKKKIIAQKRTGMQLKLGKESNPMLVIASFFWLLFVLLSLFHLLAIGNDVMTILS